MCSTMAITTSFFNGIGMGVAVTIILTLLQRDHLRYAEDYPRQDPYRHVHRGDRRLRDLRGSVCIQAFLPALADSLGVFIPLIVVNCIILGRAEAFSYKNGIAASFFDGIFQGIGYTWCC